MAVQKYRALMMLAVVSFIVISCKQQAGTVLSESALGNITVGEFENSFLSEKFNYDSVKAYHSTFEERKDFLKEMIFRNIIFDQAEKNRIDTLKEVRNEYNKRVSNNAVIDGLIQDSLRNKIYTDLEIQKAYSQRSKKYFPKHILLDVKKHGEEKASKTIDSLYEKLQKGEKFEDLARVYSDDVSTGVNGGELGWIFPYDTVKEFEESMLSLKKGEYSKPFKTVYGYHILFLADVKENMDRKDFKSEKKTIMQELDRKHSAELNDKYMRLIDMLFEKYSVKIDSVQAKTLIKKLKEYGSNPEKDKDPLDRFTQEEISAVVGSYEAERIEAKDIIAALKMYPKESRPQLKSYDDIKMYMIDRFRNRLLERYAAELGYTERKEFVDAARNGMYATYKDRIIRKFVRDSVVMPTDEEIEKFYLDHKEELFRNEDGSYSDLLKVKPSIINSIKSDRFGQRLKDWENELYKEYKVVINYIALENTFRRIEDDRK